MRAAALTPVPIDDKMRDLRRDFRQRSQLYKEADIVETLPLVGAEHRRPELASSPRAWRGTAGALVIIAAAVLLAHGWSLWDGLFLDDHLHRLRFQDGGWSWRALLEDATIKPDEFIATWWQDRPAEWRYVRPFAILLGKFVYQLSGGSVKALHATSLALHWATCVLVYALVVQMTRRRAWAVVAALLMAVYSHSVYAVGWLASQNSVLQTALTLAALLAYVRASRLDIYAAPRENAKELRPRSLNTGWFLLTLLLWGLGLFSRENAIVLPVFAVAFDLAFAGWAQVRRRIPTYAVMGGIALAFAAYRLLYFYTPMPDFYIRRPNGLFDVEFGLWWLAKLIHYLTAVVWLSPMTIGPTGRFNPWREAPGDCVFMLAILAIMGAGYFMAARRARGWWIWPLWMLLGLLPIVSMMATPHCGYMPGVGFAVAMVLGPALRERLGPVSIGRWSKAVAIWFLIATCTYIPIYRAMWNSMLAAERYTIASVEAMPPPPEAQHLCFINLPFVNIYAQVQLGEKSKSQNVEMSKPEVAERQTTDSALGTQGKGLAPRPSPLAPSVHVLTYSPNLLKMDAPCRLEQLDDYSFRVRVEGRPYFSGALGRFLIEGLRGGRRFQTGETVPGELFDVQIDAAEVEGVRELTFRFHEPLASPQIVFYVATNQCGAARVKFWKGGPPTLSPSDSRVEGVAGVAEAARRVQAGEARAADALFTAAASEDTTVSAAARTALLQVAWPVAEAMAAPVQDVSLRPKPTPEDWTRVRRWWFGSVDDETVRVVLGAQGERARLRNTREVLFNIREMASRIIRTDLYLTGPPYPGPR
jgi:hypothetical protein